MPNPSHLAPFSGIPVASSMSLFWAAVFFGLIFAIAYVDPITLTGWPWSHAHMGYSGSMEPNSHSDRCLTLSSVVMCSNEIYSGNERDCDSTSQLPQFLGDVGWRTKMGCQMQQVTDTRCNSPAVFPISTGHQPAPVIWCITSVGKN